MGNIISDAVARYERERDRYIKLASRVADLCQNNIIGNNAIRAQVTFRTKSVKSFEGKLHRLSNNPNFKKMSVDDIFNRVGDFAGVRIATYRPEDEDRVTDKLLDVFTGHNGGACDIDRKDKLNPEKAKFYRATHCQVHLKDEELLGDYTNLRGASCEVQVCSMMAHVWNEIEHDIGYKPEGEGPSSAEKGLLEALGHLARSGDAIITRLLDANYQRMTEQTGDFSDVYDFVAQLRHYYGDADLSVNAGQIFEEAQLLKLNSVDQIKNQLGRNALSLEGATIKISEFNTYLEQTGDVKIRLNSASADLLLIIILEKYSKSIVANTTESQRNGRNSRIYKFASKYIEYLEGSSNNQSA